MAETCLKNNEVIKKAYKKQVFFYDILYGIITKFGRKRAVNLINKRSGKVLEVGVGTGLSLPSYMKHLEIYSIDISPDMLKKARQRIHKKGLYHVKELKEMSADALECPDNFFDTVVAMYVMTVVPDPDKVMSELKRVCKPGGEILLVNHFSKNIGIQGWMERKIMPYSDEIGWRSIFPEENVLGQPELKLMAKEKIQPTNIFTLLRFRKVKDEAL